MKYGKKTAPVVQTMSEAMPAPFVDEVSEAEKYYGWAPIGTMEDEDGWRIMKESKEGTVTKRLYASGSMDYKFRWSERANYKYSR